MYKQLITIFFVLQVINIGLTSDTFLDKEVQVDNTISKNGCSTLGPGLEPFINDDPNFEYSSCSYIPKDFMLSQYDEDPGEYDIELLEKNEVDYQFISGTIPIKNVENFPGHNVYEVENPAPRMYYQFISKNGADLQNIDENIPIILWLQGGPGASGHFGSITEMGPCRVSKNKKLIFPKYAWTEFAHMIFVDQPLGVGLSITPKNTEDPKTCKHRIDFTKSATESAAVLDQFLEKLFTNDFDCLTSSKDKKLANLFKKLTKNPFYVFGESFAGHYGPALVSRLATKEKLSFNLAGLGVGDGITEEFISDTVYSPYFTSAGIISGWRSNYYKGFTGTMLEQIMKGDYKEAREGHYCFDGSDTVNCKKKVLQTNSYNFQMYQKDTISEDMYPDWLNSEEVKKMFSDVLKVVPREKLETFSYSSNNTYFAFAPESPKNYVMNYTVILPKYPTLIFEGQFDHGISNNGVQSMMADIDWVDIQNFNNAQKYPFYVDDQKTGLSKYVGNLKQFGNLNFMLVNKAGHLVPANQLYVSHQFVSKFVTKNL